MKENPSNEKRHAFYRQLLLVKLTAILMLALCLQVNAKGFGQVKINLQLHDITIKRMLKEVEKQTTYRFVYHTGTLPEDKKISISVVDADLAEVLSKAFTNLPLNYSVKEDNLVVIYASASAAKADRVIKGRVLGADNSPLLGVSINVTGTTIGTMTDANGFYSIKVPETATTLEFSLVGYVAQKLPINDRTVINITMETTARKLDEVIITGYTNYSKSKSVSAATVVGADKINDVPVVSFEQTLQGRVPGLSVQSTSGQPGTSANVVLRGVGTIGGASTVLYIYDGVPIEPNVFQSLNPQDFESVTVLKDASAKAMYGSRGSNGVIVITSKKGKAGRIAVEYKSQYGISTMTTPTFEMMNTSQRKEFEEEVGLETGDEIGPFWTYSKKNPAYQDMSLDEQKEADHIVDSLGKINTNWKDLFFRKGKFMEQQVSVSGGNENVRFYTSMNYYDQQGIAINTGLKRYSFKNNLDITTGRLTANFNVNIGYSNSRYLWVEGSTRAYNPMASVYYALPYEKPYANDGTLITSGNEDIYPVLDLREGSNGLDFAQNSVNKTDQLKTITSASLNFTIAKGLVAKTRLGIDLGNNTNEAWVNPDSYSGTTVDGEHGSFGEGYVRRFGLISTSGFTYNNTFNKKHELEASALFEFLKNTYKSFGYTGYNIDPALPQTPASIPSSSDPAAAITGGRTQNAMASYIGLLRYTYNGKYTVNGTFRYDGSSAVPEKNRWNALYSIGATWNAKRESFLQSSNLISDARLRASYGTTASPFGGDFTYLPTFTKTSYAGASGTIPDNPGNPNYDWEYAKELNLGADLGFLNQRIRLSVDFYNRITSNLFFDYPVSATSGIPGTTLPYSAGKMRNRGVEIDVQGDVIKTKDLTWSIGGNVSFNKNVVLDIGTADQFASGYTGIVKVGLPFGAHYAPKYLGPDPQTGLARYYDPATGGVTTDYDELGLSVAEFGTYIPQITGGLNTSLLYKNFSLSGLFTFNAKVHRYNNEDYYNEQPKYAGSNQSTRMLYDRWEKPGDIKLLPSIAEKRSYSSRDIQDASFVRLRNVMLSYQFTKTALKSLKYVSGIRIFVQGENLLTWTKWRGFDPENGNEYAVFSYPSARTYTAGLSINF